MKKNKDSQNGVFVVWMNGECSYLKSSEFERILKDRELWVCRLYKGGREVFSRVRSWLDNGDVLIEDCDMGKQIKFYE